MYRTLALRASTAGRVAVARTRRPIKSAIEIVSPCAVGDEG